MTSHADLSDPTDDDDRQPVEDDALPPGGLPHFLTVVEAARVLRIGRTSAYQLAKQWCYTDGREGLPVVRVGRPLRVPRHALERLARGDLSMWRSRPAWWSGLRRRTDGRVTVSADTAPSTLLQPRQRHSIVAMSWGEVELEPEVRAWYLSLDEDNQARVQFNVDRLAERGPLLDEPFTKQLDGKLRELRFYLDGRPTRVTYWIASGRRIILLTVFVKSQRRERREVERAKRAFERCLAEGHTAEEDED